jgi:hypothetical protein
MSTEYCDLLDGSHLSDCCGAPALGEVCDGAGICSRCRDHATFDRVETRQFAPAQQDLINRLQSEAPEHE